jgi:serine/threonine protein kinase
MGVVWLALDERLQRPVAVKQLWPGTAGDSAAGEESRQRVMREGRIAARLHHPHAVAVHDVAEHNGQPVLVMEYLPSRSLAAVVAEQGPLTPVTVARVGAQAASALAAAHAAGIVHRDVKPANLLVGDDGTVKIADFGISHATGDATVTRAGVVAGTPAYLAPETARGHQPTPDSDVFSLGSTLYAAVEGTPPFGEDADNALAVLHRVAAADVPPPQRAGSLTPVLMAMLRADPAQRPTAGQVTDALQAVADGRPFVLTALDPAAGRTQPVHASSATVPVAPTRGFGGTRLDTPPVDHEPGWWAARRRFLLPAIAVLVAALAVTILVIQLTPTPRTAAPSTPTKAPLDSATLERTVSDYYALLPGHPDNAWARLGPVLQARGLPAYRAYWSGITRLTVTAPPRVTGADSVTVGLELTLPNGTTIRETHQVGINAVPLITSDTVLDSSTTTPAPPPVPAAQEHNNTGSDSKKHGGNHGNGNHGDG